MFIENTNNEHTTPKGSNGSINIFYKYLIPSDHFFNVLFANQHEDSVIIITQHWTRVSSLQNFLNLATSASGVIIPSLHK